MRQHSTIRAEMHEEHSASNMKHKAADRPNTRRSLVYALLIMFFFIIVWQFRRLG